MATWKPDPGSSQSREPTFQRKCRAFLATRGFTNLNLLTTYEKSYMTGLNYCHNVEKPSLHRIYLVVPQPDNKVDPNALQIVNESNQRLGWVPRSLAAEIRTFSGELLLTCYCTGRTTARSAQCYYFLFAQDEKNDRGPTNPSTLPHCGLCEGQPCLINPCGHATYCQHCLLSLTPKICLECRSDL